MRDPSEHAARIIQHYLRALTEHAGLRWTDANDRDMQMLAELLGACKEAHDTIPPYHAEIPPVRSDRVTEVFEREPAGNASIPDPAFQRWRGQQRWSEDDDVRRIVTRR